MITAIRMDDPKYATASTETIDKKVSLIHMDIFLCIYLYISAICGRPIKILLALVKFRPWPWPYTNNVEVIGRVTADCAA